ncbi:MAG: GAF domain-containing protein [Anaerolineales bacterium]
MTDTQTPNENRLLNSSSDQPEQKPESAPFDRWLSLGVKVPLFATMLLLLGFLFFTFLSFQTSRSALTDQLEKALLAQATSQAEFIRSYLIWTRSVAVDLAAMAGSVDFDQDALLNLIQSTLANNEQVYGSTIAYEPYRFEPDLYYWAPYYSREPDGKLRFTQLGNPEYNYFEWDWYTLPKRQLEPVLSPAYFDEGGGEIWMVTWSVPFFDSKGSFKGVATADIAFSQTQEIVRQIAVGEKGYAFLIDSQGIVLGIGEQGGEYQIMVDSMLTSRSQTQDGSWTALIQAMMKGEAGFASAIDPNGQSVFIAYQPIGLDTGWSLGLAFPRTELFQPITQLRKTLVGFALLLAIGFSIILNLFAQTITHPLQALSTYAINFLREGLEKDQPLSPIQIRTNDELEDLANSFNQMTAELKGLFATLEQRVAERTKALETLLEVSRRLSAVTSPRQLAINVVEQVQAAFGYYHAHIYFFDEQNENLVMAGGTGAAGAAMLAAGHSIPKGRGLVGRAAETNQPVLAADVSQTIGWLPNPLLPETKSEAAVPIAIGDQVLGVLDVQQNVVNGLSENDLVLLQALASQIAIWLQNARIFEQSKSQADLEATVNTIGQQIQRATTVEETLQIAIRELGLALGAPRIKIKLGTADHRQPTQLEEEKA